MSGSTINVAHIYLVTQDDVPGSPAVAGGIPFRQREECPVELRWEVGGGKGRPAAHQ